MANLLRYSIILLCLVARPALASAPTPLACDTCEIQRILLIHPAVEAPYDLIVEHVRAGLARGAQRPVESYTLPDAETDPRLAQWLTKRRTHSAIVTIGRQALDAVTATATDIPVFAAAVEQPPSDEVNGISIFIAPQRFFETLSAIAPHITTVHVIYLSDKAQTLTPAINAAGRIHGINVVAAGVNNLRDAVITTEKLLDNMQHGEAMWLHRGVIRLNEEVMMPLIVSKSWRLRVPVFTSDAEYVKRGLLFSLFPDYEGMGISLGERLGSDQLPLPQGLEFLTTTKGVLNMRIARHLDVKPKRSTLNRFEIIFPVK